jgi:hypothetical protein
MKSLLWLLYWFACVLLLHATSLEESSHLSRMDSFSESQRDLLLETEDEPFYDYAENTGDDESSHSVQGQQSPPSRLPRPCRQCLDCPSSWFLQLHSLSASLFKHLSATDETGNYQVRLAAALSDETVSFWRSYVQTPQGTLGSEEAEVNRLRMLHVLHTVLDRLVIKFACVYFFPLLFFCARCIVECKPFPITTIAINYSAVLPTPVAARAVPTSLWQDSFTNDSLRVKSMP